MLEPRMVPHLLARERLRGGHRRVRTAGQHDVSAREHLAREGDLLEPSVRDREAARDHVSLPLLEGRDQVVPPLHRHHLQRDPVQPREPVEHFAIEAGMRARRIGEELVLRIEGHDDHAQHGPRLHVEEVRGRHGGRHGERRQRENAHPDRGLHVETSSFTRRGARGGCQKRSAATRTRRTP